MDAGSVLPPPPPGSTPPPPPPPPPGARPGRDGRRRRDRWAGRSTSSALPWILAALALVVVGIPILLFSAGEDLFGSDRGTIDSYNQDVLDSCPLPDGSTLVQVSVGPQLDETGGRYRGMSYLYASPSSPDEVAGFFGVDVGRAMLVSPPRACQYEQRPSVLVQPVSATSVPTTAPSDDEIVPDSDASSADETVDVRMVAEVPSGTQTLFRLHVQQQETSGIF